MFVLHDGEDLICCKGCKVVATPGHTPGHIALYLEQDRTIVAGDAIALENGNPILANPQFVLDAECAQDSMSRLLNMDATTILCYHGGEYRFN